MRHMQHGRSGPAIPALLVVDGEANRLSTAERLGGEHGRQIGWLNYKILDGYFFIGTPAEALDSPGTIRDGVCYPKSRPISPAVS